MNNLFEKWKTRIPKYSEIINIKIIEIIFIVSVIGILLNISFFTISPLENDIPKSS